MRLFRDEEHVRRAHPEPGAIFAIEQLWTLAQRWYGDRLDPAWTPHDRVRNQDDLASAGLTGQFWELPA
ncbi:MAG TPA: hypothetical protein VJ986_11490 [Gaiellaceae bacterium]|nr:hypothetical protein [Gaiellaceae bacterium]